MALFFCYNHINVRHHIPDFPPEMLDALTPERLRFFNEVYHPQCVRWKWVFRRQYIRRFEHEARWFDVQRE